MRLSQRGAAVSIAVGLFALVALLRVGAADALGLGEAALDRFESQPYGFDIPRDTHPFFLTWSIGDGQAFMSIASDLDGDGNSTGLGYQSYRMSRIGLSGLARILALGDVDRLQYSLAAASFLSYGALLALAVRLTDSIGPRALLLGASPAALIGTVFDSAEGLGSALLVLGLTASTVPVAVLAGAALGWTRPSYGTAILPSRTGLWAAAATIGAGALLQVLLAVSFGVPFSGSGDNIVVPLSGYLRALPDMSPVVMMSALAVLIMAAILLRNATDASHVGWYRVSAVVSALLALSVGPSTFVGPLSPLRVSGALVVLIVLAPLFTRSEHAAAALEGVRVAPSQDAEA